MGRKYKPPETDRICDAIGCKKTGPYKAPRPRGETGWYWFCIEHVRDYNTNWDWFQGMSTPEIEQAHRDTATWERKTWTRQISPKAAARFFRLSGMDPDDTVAGVGAFSNTENSSQNAYEQPLLSPDLSQAFKTLGVPSNAKKEIIRRRYRSLVKDHHPDLHPAHIHSKNSDVLKTITAAYSLLRKTGYV